MMTSIEENQPLPTTNVAHIGIIGKTFVFSTKFKNRIQIIDTGASDHMMRDSNQLKPFLPSPQLVISTANGSTSPITGEGSVNTLTLDIVIVVPSLEYNLLSISKIYFNPCWYCNFLALILCLSRRSNLEDSWLWCQTRQLYYLELTENKGSKISQANQASSESKAGTTIWLWHCRLGHISFGYLKKLQPQLFSSLSDFDFHCDICELAKSHRISYLLSLNKSLEPYEVIHSNIWGLAKVRSTSRAHQSVTFIDECTLRCLAYKKE